MYLEVISTTFKANITDNMSPLFSYQDFDNPEPGHFVQWLTASLIFYFCLLAFVMDLDLKGKRKTINLRFEQKKKTQDLVLFGMLVEGTMLP
ncbi:hypothetical protein SLEP1_g34492 [Rubroshorea leprosula]|uniref:ATP synthase F0 subunit 8 n=1 Tax=Rubroshorea leprosula TaxID=152421 RepID=A0AAV5KKB2_9ROSI|nr:hypothetical protein SLEP1_g34492 [Rubroshorea leprosula]